MKSEVEERFYDLLFKLPKSTRRQAREAYRQFKLDPYHPSLHFKKLVGLTDRYSVRIGRDYRAIGIMDGNTITWYWIGTHSEYDDQASR